MQKCRKKDGRRISTTGRRKYTGMMDGTRQSLTISDITKDDAGRYECVVLCHGTSVKTEANLVVKVSGTAALEVIELYEQTLLGLMGDICERIVHA